VKYPDGGADNFAAVRNMRTFLDIGVAGGYMLGSHLLLSGSVVFRDEHNPLNEGEVLINGSDSSTHRYNFSVAFGGKYVF